MLSTWAILFEEKTFHKYKTRREVMQLLGTALLEPIFYHPRTVWWAIRGNFDYLRGIRSWGNMEREGFGKDKKKKNKETRIRDAETVHQFKLEQQVSSETETPLLEK
jgi:hypothetical protein